MHLPHIVVFFILRSRAVQKSYLNNSLFYVLVIYFHLTISILCNKIGLSYLLNKYIIFQYREFRRRAALNLLSLQTIIVSQTTDATQRLNEFCCFTPPINQKPKTICCQNHKNTFSINISRWHYISISITFF